MATRGQKTKNVFSKVLILAMCFSLLAGCGKKDEGADYSKTAETKVMVIGDYDIYMDELLVYSINACVAGGENYETIASKIDSYKESALSLIRTTKIEYDVAIHNETELDEDEIAAVELLVSNFKASFSEDFLSGHSISDEVIRKVFTEQAVVEKFKTGIKNQMGNDINDDFTEAFEDVRFNSIYYLVFPTVEVDENNEPLTDDEGNYVELSDDDKEAVLDKATEAADRINAGEDYMDIIAEYNIEAYSSEGSGYIGAYATDELNETLGALDNGESTEPIEQTTSYTDIVMIERDDLEIKEGYVYQVASDKLDEEFTTLETTWLQSITVDTVNDMEGTVWADFDFSEFAKELVDEGLLAE